MSREYSFIRSFSQSIGRALACLVALFIFTAMAGAATYTVDTASDDGNLLACTAAANDCSLRGAINRANGTLDSDVITFASSYTITLRVGSLALVITDAATSGALTITNSTAASNLVIDGNNDNKNGEDFTRLGRVFTINQGGNLTLNGVTVRNGISNGGAWVGGGGIFNNNGTLLLTNSIISGNRAPDDVSCGSHFTITNRGGGGIHNFNGIMTIENSTVSGNASGNGGGGILNEGILTLTNSTVSGNFATYGCAIRQGLDGNLCLGGGGICNFGTLNLTNSTVASNSINVLGGGGGGISNWGIDATLNAKNSAVVSNSAAIASSSSGSSGGGVYNSRGTSNLTNVTVAYNTAISLGSGSTVSGGGVGNSTGGQVVLFNTTVAYNSAESSGGGIRNFGDDSILVLRNTIVAKNSAPAAPDYDGIVFGFSSFNLIGDGTGMTGGLLNGNFGNQVGTAATQIDPKLNPNLALNGGTTLNLALLTGSPAIDKGKSTANDDNGTDQRGLIRPVDNPNIANGGGNGADIGAFEVQIVPAFDLTVTKTHIGNFTKGDIGRSYSITVANSGDASAATSGTVSVVDTLPTGLTATDMTGFGWTCTLATLTCTRSDTLAIGASYPVITLTVNVASNAPASVINNVSVSGVGEINRENNTASDPTTIDGVFDLTVTKTHTGNFTQGGVGTYTIIAKNSGAGAYSGTIIVTDFLPDGLTLKSIPVGTGWNCAMDDVAKAFSCDRTAVLAAGASYPPVTATVDVAANAPSSVTNTVSVAGSGEINKTNNTASDLTIINAATTFSISGTVMYGVADAGQTPAAISGVNLNAAGTANASAISNNSGVYQLSNLASGNYTVTPSKSGDIKGINSLDATRIQQHLVGLTTLAANQIIAADTDGNGIVNSLDATRIQQRAVGMQTANVIGQWKFVPSSRQYSSLTGNAGNQDYQAVLVGEVSGNWASVSSFVGDLETEEEILPKQGNQSEAAERFNDELEEQIVERTKQSADSQSNESKFEPAMMGASVAVSLPANVSASTGSSIIVPVTMGAVPAGNPIESFDFTVFYDPAVLQTVSPFGSNAGTLSANCSVLANSSTAGRIVVSGACATAITTTSGGVLYNLNFNVIGTSGQQTGLLFYNPSTGTQTFQFNSGNPSANTTNGLFSVLPGPTVASVTVSGKVTNNQGRGIRNVLITMTDSQGRVRTAQTTTFGYYRFDNVAAGETVTITAKARRFRFGQSSIVRTTNESVTNADFISQQ